MAVLRALFGDLGGGVADQAELADGDYARPRRSWWSQMA
jgi:hypothetical protein